MNDQQHRRVGAGGCAAAWTTDRLDAREKLERPLVRADWPALTAFSMVGLFHQKQRGVKVVMMIDQSDDRVGRRHAPPSKLVSDCSGFSSDRQWPSAGTDGLRETKHLVSTVARRGWMPMNLWVCGRMQNIVETASW